MWSFTFLIIPAAVVAGAACAAFIVHKISKSRSASKVEMAQSGKALTKQQKKLEKARRKQERKLAKQQRKEQKKAEKWARKHPGASVSQEPVKVVEQTLSPAKHLRALDNNFRFYANDFDIVKRDKEKFAEFSQLQKHVLATDSSADIAKAKARLAELDKYFITTYGRSAHRSPRADFCASVVDQNGELVMDNRNYISVGKDDTKFEEACAVGYSATEGDKNPTVFQVSLPSRAPMIVAATQNNLLQAGMQDILDACEELGETKAKAYLCPADHNLKPMMWEFDKRDELTAFLQSVLHQEQVESKEIVQLPQEQILPEEQLDAVQNLNEETEKPEEGQQEVAAEPEDKQHATTQAL